MTDPKGLRAGWQREPGTLGDRDLRFFDAMLAWATRQHGVDSSRVFVTGHSNGGMMTYLLWGTRAGVVAAFAPSAAVLSASARDIELLAGAGALIARFFRELGPR